jgi:hypothetical protein
MSIQSENNPLLSCMESLQWLNNVAYDDRSHSSIEREFKIIASRCFDDFKFIECIGEDNANKIFEDCICLPKHWQDMDVAERKRAIGVIKNTILDQFTMKTYLEKVKIMLSGKMNIIKGCSWMKGMGKNAENAFLCIGYYCWNDDDFIDHIGGSLAEEIFHDTLSLSGRWCGLSLSERQDAIDTLKAKLNNAM